MNKNIWKILDKLLVRNMQYNSTGGNTMKTLITASKQSVEELRGEAELILDVIIESYNGHDVYYVLYI